MPRRITGSSVGLAMACPASHALPQAFSEVGAAADRGTALHAYIRDALEHGEEIALASVPKAYAMDAAGVDLVGVRNLIGDGEAFHEIAFALNVNDGKCRVVGRNIGRNYGELADGEIAMTADLVVSHGNGAATVLDYKTGRSAADAWQLRALSVACSLAFGWDDIKGVFAYLQDDGTWKPYVEEYTAIDLDANLASIREVYGNVRAAVARHAFGETLDVTEGKHCTYCPAKLNCPAQVARLSALGGSPLVKSDPQFLTLDKLGELYPRIRFYEAQLKAAKEYIEGIAKETPIPLGDGKVLRGVEVSREYIDGAVAHELIAKTRGVEAANTACEMKASKESIKRALGKDAANAINEIREAGGVRTAVNVYAREVKQ